MTTKSFSSAILCQILALLASTIYVSESLLLLVCKHIFFLQKPSPHRVYEHYNFAVILDDAKRMV